MATTTYGSTAAQNLLRDSFGYVNAGQGLPSNEDEVRLLNGLLALGWSPEKVAALSDADPNRRFLGDAVTRALRAGISEDQIRRAITFDEVARTEQDPTRRAQRLAEALGMDMGRVGAKAAQYGGTADAWIRAVDEISRAGRQPNTQTLMGSDLALQTFRQYATFQPATYTGKGTAVPAAPGGATTLPAQPVSGQPPAPFEQRSGGWHMPGQPYQPEPVPGGGAPPTGPGGPGGPGGSNIPGLTPERKPSREELLAGLRARFGWASAFMDIPEIARIVEDVANGRISADMANDRWTASDYYKSTTAAFRTWKVFEAGDPATAGEQIQAQADTIVRESAKQGFTVDPARALQIAQNSKRFGWSDQLINSAIASEVHWDPNGAKTGLMATLKAAQRDSLVPLSDQAMTQWTQSIIAGTKTTEDFGAYLRDQATSLFPALKGALENDPTMTVRTYLDSYGQTAAKTLGINPDDIDWTDMKWNRFINQVDPKTGMRKVMNMADMQRTLIADQTYGYGDSTGGKQAKAGLAKGILQQFGYLAGPGFSGGNL